MGGLDSENGFLRYVCKHLHCVVVTVNYRHAPEHVYPAAIEDCVAGYTWVVDNAASMALDTARVTIGGLSAGGCLAAILSMKLAPSECPAQPIFQMLLLPVIDNTADVSTTWSTSQHAAFLTPSRMKWYREKYFTDPRQAEKWDASPCFAPPETMAKSPKTFVGVAECDLLAPEALQYADALRATGVQTQVEIYKGATHSTLVLAGIHQVGKKLVTDACVALAAALGVPYEPQSAPVLPQFAD
ncbi:Alpha/beta hydrolase fold-3 [Xylariomycetidae sp. FL0641]|nr:Alpha/beta hydrolase fold-3 [Xylariomycetidae sp. FL0641]